MQKQQIDRGRLFYVICRHVNQQLFDSGKIDETLYEYANDKLLNHQMKKEEGKRHGSV